MVSTYPRSNPSKALWALIAVVGLVLYTVSQHAIDKHGPIAIVVYDECGRHSLGSWRNPQDGHIANVCQLDDGSWAVRFDWVEDGIRKNTAYVRERARSMTDMQAYLRNNGYTKWIGRGVFP